jgi:glycosyltransferase involved in cell wall biosynthesis
VRVLFDGYWWSSGPYSNRQVLREIILGWEHAHPEDDLVVAVRRAHRESARAELPARVALVPTRVKPQGISAMVELPILARRVRADVTLTHNFTPLLGRSAVFIHDLMFVTNPEWFTPLERLYFSLMRFTAPTADLVLTSSKTEAARIDRVTRTKSPTLAVGLGVPSALTSADDEPIPFPDEIESFTVVVGRLNIRKNLAGAIEGALASGRVDARNPLLIIGEPSGKAAEYSEQANRAISAGIVRFAGFVSSGQLAWAYRNAAAFMFLSLDEGFGIPAVEAMAFGAPVVASDIPVFREILGDHAEYADPMDPEDIGRALGTTLDRAAASGRPTAVPPSALGYTWPAVVDAVRERVQALVDDRKRAGFASATK